MTLVDPRLTGPVWELCRDIPYTNLSVVGTDPHGFDGDNDGIGCETYRPRLICGAYKRIPVHARSTHGRCERCQSRPSSPAVSAVGSWEDDRLLARLALGASSSSTLRATPAAMSTFHSRSLYIK